MPLLLVSTDPVSVLPARPDTEASGALCVTVFSPLLRANGPATGQAPNTGALWSMLMPLTVAGVARLPALSVHSPVLVTD